MRTIPYIDGLVQYQPLVDGYMTDLLRPAATVGEDKLLGIREIAAFLGESQRRTSYLLEQRLIPAGKRGRVWIASRRALLAHHARTTGMTK